MNYNKDRILKMIDDVIDGNRSIAEWDYFVSVKHNDPFADYWSDRCREIETKFRGEQGKMITEDGVHALRCMREELIETSHSGDVIPDD